MKTYTHYVVREAMRIVAPQVRLPKCVRDGLVKPNKIMNKKQIVPYKLSLELKELGFDEACFGYYIETEKWQPASYSREGIVYPSNRDLLPQWVAAPTYSQIFDWFEEHFDLYVEWLIEGWGDDECISKPSYRVFIWEVGKPKPNPSDDLGGGTREQMNPEVLRGLIEIAKLGPDWDSLNGFEMDELD